MLPLDQLYPLAQGGGALLSRFTMAVKKVVFSIAEQPLHSHYATAQQVARDRKYEFLATQVLDFASSRPGNPLSETGASITDEEVEAIVATYLPKVVTLIG